MHKDGKTSPQPQPAERPQNKNAEIGPKGAPRIARQTLDPRPRGHPPLTLQIRPKIFSNQRRLPTIIPEPGRDLLHLDNPVQVLQDNQDGHPRTPAAHVENRREKIAAAGATQRRDDQDRHVPRLGNARPPVSHRDLQQLDLHL
jgi:hypothetical protein